MEELFADKQQSVPRERPVPIAPPPTHMVMTGYPCPALLILLIMLCTVFVVLVVVHLARG